MNIHCPTPAPVHHSRTTYAIHSHNRRVVHPRLLIGLLLATMLPALHACSEGSSDQATAPEMIIPAFVSAESAPLDNQERLYLRDYSAYLNGLSILTTVSRESEYGNAAYRPEEYPENMAQRAEQWLSLAGQIHTHFNNEGRFSPWLEPTRGGYRKASGVDLSVYPHLVYAYHMHHRSGRFEHTPGLTDRLNRGVTAFLVSPGRYLLDEHYTNGRFHHEDGSVDRLSMSYGLGGIHSHTYAWISWKKPDGVDEMGLLQEHVLAHHLGYSIEALLQMYREIDTVLEERWDEPTGIYLFDNETTWPLDAIGALIRGKKSMYDYLYMFGTHNDRTRAGVLFDRTARIVEQMLPLAKPWGMPSEIAFTPEGARAAADTVELYHWYQFLNHLGGGYAFDREPEGTPGFLRERRADLHADLNRLADQALLGVLNHHLNEDGYLATAVSYADGSITDGRISVAATGMFVAVSGNLYGKGTAFERASDWQNAPENVVNRSRALFDLSFRHMHLLENLEHLP